MLEVPKIDKGPAALVYKRDSSGLALPRHDVGDTNLLDDSEGLSPLPILSALRMDPLGAMGLRSSRKVKFA